MKPKAAVTAPRFFTEHHQQSFRPYPNRADAIVGKGTLVVDSLVSMDVRSALSARGHEVSQTKHIIGRPVMIYVDPNDGKMYAAGDPKGTRHAAVVEE